MDIVVGGDGAGEELIVGRLAGFQGFHAFVEGAPEAGRFHWAVIRELGLHRVIRGA